MSITREIRDPDRLADPCRYDLSRLTAAERLFLWRHRQKTTCGRLLGRNGSSMNQVEAAKKLGISAKLYNNLENGAQFHLTGTLEEVPKEYRTVLEVFEGLRDITFTAGELCFLARRRSGALLTTLERAFGVSRPHYHALERAGAPDMVRFWEERGFRFPEAT